MRHPLSRVVSVAVRTATTRSCSMVLLTAATLLASAQALQSQAAPLPASSLAVETSRRDGWQAWWNSASAPTRWSGPVPALASAVRWTRVAPGVEHGVLRVAGTGEARRIAIVLLRVDPRRASFSLQAQDDGEGGYLPWTIADVTRDSDPRLLAAFNAGQFSVGRPWGWLVTRGAERQRPGVGPLSSAFVIDSAGAVSLVDAAGIDARRRAGGVAEAFQSYPTILRGDGEVPEQLQGWGRGVSVSHRDSRFALGLTRDGRVLLALTRFDLLGGALSELPLGPTVPEMSAIMGALGCAQAMLLDGGISGQMHIAGAGTWEGNRSVPLAMLVHARGTALKSSLR